VIQSGAMLALTWCYRERLIGMARDAFSRRESLWLIVKILVAFVPAAFVGLLFHDFIERALFRPSFVAAMLFAGGIAILAIDRQEKSKGLVDLERMSFGQAFTIGIGQTLSLLPGVSRSAATILAGMVAGLDRQAATDFSFLLALPTRYAASLFSLVKDREALLHGGEGMALLVGLAAAYVSALVVIRAFLAYVRTRTLAPFGWYRIAVGIALLYWLA
jgi:undecaprenyl-diphosphatase